MTSTRLDGLYLLLLGSVAFVLAGFALESRVTGSLQDFKGVYYGTRCLLEHCDPYNESELLHVFLREGDASGVLLSGQRQAVMLYVNLPATFIFIAPLAMLPWGPAHLLWMILTAGSFILASILIWNIGASRAPVLSGGLIALLLVNSIFMLMIGNTAGIAVSLCAIAVWCFLRERYVPAGILCLAVSLAIKPHDAGLVWLYFLLAGAGSRKRALQTLAVTVVLCLASVLWVAQVAPHWMQELRSNMAAISAHGGINDPGPNSINSGTATMVISLQSVISVFRDDPGIYNTVGYLVCGALLLVWSVRTVLSGFSPARAWLALAAVSAFTMLATYHRPQDAKLLLLSIPACAMLWAEGGPTGWFALLTTAAGIVSTGDIPLLFLIPFTKNLRADTTVLSGKLLTVMLARPAPLVLLVMGIFYLWVYARRCFSRSQEQAQI